MKTINGKLHDLEICYHCGNQGLQEVVYKEEQGWGGDNELYEEMHWYLLKCPVCKKVSLKQSYTNEAMVDRDLNYIYEDEIVYPKTKYNFTNTPKQIKDSFEAAVKASNIDNSVCLLSLRRTLEMICKDKGAKGHTLDDKIADLADRNILPSTLKNSSWLIRNMGNDAAHADDIEYTDYEVNQIIEFIEIIINYLYEVPNKIEALKDSRENRKENLRRKGEKNDKININLKS